MFFSLVKKSITVFCPFLERKILFLKARPPIEFLNLGVANPLITQMLLSDNFSMNTKFVDLTEIATTYGSKDVLILSPVYMASRVVPKNRIFCSTVV